MVKEIKTTISKKDLYSKEYYKSKKDEKVGDSKVAIKRGLVEVLSKILLLDE